MNQQRLLNLKVLFGIFLFSVTGAFPAHAETILFIGDSHSVGPFGRELDRLLRKNPSNKVATYAMCGSIGSWWKTGHEVTCGAYEKDITGKVLIDSLRAVPPPPAQVPTPLLSHLLNTLHPSITIAEFGTNYGPDMGTTGGDDRTKADMRATAEMIKQSGSKCIWVGLPKTRVFSKVEAHLFTLTQEAVGDLCTVINSLALIDHYPISCNDGKHYSCPAGVPIANKWADQVFQKAFP